MSEEVEGRVTKTLSQEFSRTESQFLSAMSKSYKFRLNSQVRAQPGTFLETSRSSNLKNRKPKVDCSQYDPRPDVGTSINPSPQSSQAAPEEAFYTIHSDSTWMIL